MRKNIFKFAILALLLVGSLCSCEKNKDKVCNVDNPLTDLPWLKKIVDDLEEQSRIQYMLLNVKIYQCTYKDGIGFLQDHGNIAFFYNCEGQALCMMGGFANETCPELKIVDQKLIWDINQ